MRALFIGLTIFAACLAPLLAQSESNDAYVARMEIEHASDTPVASPATTTLPAVETTGSDTVYATIDGKQVRGYLARPVAGTATGGVVVIHEWWGLNDNIRAMANRLAGEGYLALAVDLYEGEVAEDREDASRLARGSAERTPALLANLRQAIDHLRSEGVEKVGVIGWCFGGGWSLQAALAFPEDIDAATIYYGRLVTDVGRLADLEAPILGIFGALDQGIPVVTVREFQSALTSLGKTASIHIYEDADHAFANPSGTRYNPDAAADAWDKTVTFFARHLR